jgi:DNA polymerase III alpha subunit
MSFLKLHEHTDSFGYDNPDEVLAMMVNFGAENRFGTHLPVIVSERIKKELDIISSTGNSAYLIKVKEIVDNIRYGRGIGLGPGRGASTSSLVNYCLGITEVNPLEYGLLFERFLWPGAIDRPQIEIDVEDSRREEIEDFGTTRMRILGLRIVDVIKQTLGLINCRYPFDVDIKNIPLDDEKTQDVFVSGNTSDIFMFQSENLRKLLKDFHPGSFNDLVLLNTLYRAGSLNLLPVCLANKRGEEKASYEIPELEAILRESYGVPVYQEQLMAIAKSVGLCDVDAVLFWKHISLKKMEYIDIRGKFIEGGINWGHSREAMKGS